MTPRFSFSLSGGKGSALISATAAHSPDGRCLVDDRARNYMEATYRSAERRSTVVSYNHGVHPLSREMSNFFFFAPLPVVNLQSVQFFACHWYFFSSTLARWLCSITCYYATPGAFLLKFN